MFFLMSQKHKPSCYDIQIITELNNNLLGYHMYVPLIHAYKIALNVLPVLFAL